MKTLAGALRRPRESSPITVNVSATGAPEDKARACLLAGGDDYELLFTAAASARADIDALSRRLTLPLHRIGRITGRAGECLLRTADGEEQVLHPSGYDHFA